ncbi:hypothetical protein V6N13_122635 [Hibiscus sabdariffa]
MEAPKFPPLNPAILRTNEKLLQVSNPISPGQSCAKLKESLNLGNVSCSQEGLPNFREVTDHTKSGGRGMDDGPKSDALGSGLVKDTMGPIVGFDVEMGLLEEESPLGNVESSKRPRVQTDQEVSLLKDSTATAANASQLKMLLDDYGDCSGQLINYDKSSIFFSANVLDYNRSDVCRILNVSEGLEFARDLGLHRIIVEGDNKGVIAKLNDQSLDFSEIGSKIRDIQIFAGSFTSCAFQFIGHLPLSLPLATEGLKSSGPHFWVDDAPATVQNLAAQDRRFVEPP